MAGKGGCEAQPGSSVATTAVMLPLLKPVLLPQQCCW